MSIGLVTVVVILCLAAIVVHHQRNKDVVVPPVEIASARIGQALPIVRSSKEPTPPPAVPAVSTVQSICEQAFAWASSRYRPVRLSDSDLMDQLYSVTEIGLERPLGDPLMTELISNVRENPNETRQFHPFAMAMRDVHTLPLRMGFDCRLDYTAAESLQSRSLRLREHLAKATSTSSLRQNLRADGAQVWGVPSAIPTLVQMLQAENQFVRGMLVELLANIDGREASRALAQRAIFDVSSEVRHAAVDALSKRAQQEYRDVLVEGLRHPWPAAAAFAAEALVKLKVTVAVPALIRLLDEPNPTAPFALRENGTETHHVRELVRINHLRNCMVCHSMSFDNSHMVRAAAPDPSAPLPPASTPAYYRPSQQNDPRRLFVRADVTYLRQDFSVVQPVADPGPWPIHQRFDYTVRTRQLSSDEWEKRRHAPKPNPQRESVLFALRELTGEDRGDASDKWQAILRRFAN